MDVGRPILAELRRTFIAAVAYSGDIVGKCVKPYVYDLFVVKLNLYSPVKTGSGNAEILKTGF